MATRKEKEYVFILVDRNDNELERKVYTFYNLVEARRHANLLLANTNMNGAYRYKIFNF